MWLYEKHRHTKTCCKEAKQVIGPNGSLFIPWQVIEAARTSVGNGDDDFDDLCLCTEG